MNEYVEHCQHRGDYSADKTDLLKFEEDIFDSRNYHIKEVSINYIFDLFFPFICKAYNFWICFTNEEYRELLNYHRFLCQHFSVKNNSREKGREITI